MPITIRTNLETDEEKNAKYKVKAEVLRKAYSQDSIAGGITKMEVDRLGDNILVDYLKGADVYLTDILAYSNYNKMLDDLAEKVDKSLRGMERYEDIYEDERIKDKMEWVINYDDKPYIFHFFNELRLIEREVNNHSMNGNYFTYKLDKFYIRAYRAKGYFSSYFYMIKSKEMETEYDVEFYERFGCHVSEDTIDELRQMLIDFYTPDVRVGVRDLSYETLSTINEFFEVRDENMRYLIRTTDSLGSDTEIHFGDLISTILNNYHISWAVIKRELRKRAGEKGKIYFEFDLEELGNMIADEDSRGVFELVKKMYYNKRGKATKKTGVGVKRR